MFFDSYLYCKVISSSKYSTLVDQLLLLKARIFFCIFLTSLMPDLYLFQIGVQGAVCIMDDEPRSVGRPCGPIDPAVCGSWKVTFSAAVRIQPDSGPVCVLGTEAHNQKCWEFLIAGVEQGLEAGQIGLRLVVKGAGQTTYNREWFIGTTCITDGR